MPPKNTKQTVAQGKGDEGEGGAARDGSPPSAEAMETGAAATAQQDAERKVADLEQQLHEAHHKLQQSVKSNTELEQQLMEADDKLHKMKASKDKLEKLLEAELKKHDGEPTGRRQSLEDRLQALGLVVGQQVITEGFSVTTPYAVTNSFEISGGALDFKVGCGCHLQMSLGLIQVKQPVGADKWSAMSPYELAQGAHVAELVSVSAHDQEQFFRKQSDALVKLGMAEPSEDRLVQTFVQLTSVCRAIWNEFQRTQHVQFKCDHVYNKDEAAKKIRVAEKVRAILDGHKDIKTEETVVIGGTNAVRFAAVLGVIAERASSLVELRHILEKSHFASTVKRVFVWPETTEKFVASNYVASLKEAVCAAAQWKHVVFIVLPMPYAAGDPNCFESFMKEFNATAPTLNNVLWLDDDWLASGYRFSRSLGANEIAVDGGAIFPEGNVSRKGAEAAVSFIRRLCSWLIVEKTGHEPIPSSSSTRTQPNGPLHQLRGGKIEKKPARGVPSRGGGGDRQPTRGRGGNNQFGSRRGQRKRGQL